MRCVVKHEFSVGDPIWISMNGTTYPGEVASLGDGFELEIVTYFGATTAHITELVHRKAKR